MAESAVRHACAPARTTLSAVDDFRRLRGRTLDLLGLVRNSIRRASTWPRRRFRVRSYAPILNSAPPVLLVAAPIKRHAGLGQALTPRGGSVHFHELC